MADDDLQNNIAQITQELIEGRIGFLFGAGMSIPSGGIGGEELAYQLVWKALYRHEHEPNEIFKEQLRAISKKYPLEAIAQGVVRKLPRENEQLIEILKQVVFEGKDPELHDGHKVMASLVNTRSLNLKMLFTTNWDNLLKDALGNNAEIITENNFTTLDKVVRGKTAIIHLHGTFADQPLIKENDLMNPNRPLFQLFLGELMTKSFVFVGYSLSDPNIRTLYFRAMDLLINTRKKLRKKTYIVFPARNDMERRVSEEVWGQREAIYIPLGADEFFNRLYAELKTNVIKDIKQQLVKRLGITTEELNNKVEEIMKIFPDFDSSIHVLHYYNAITGR